MKRQPKSLEAQRQVRSEDQETRDRLGLRFAGLVYVQDDWRTAPKELFVSRFDHSEFIKHGNNDYRLKTETFTPIEPVKPLTDEDFQMILNLVTQ